KIGSGECNNYPLVRHIAAFGKPVILSTGMNDIESVRPSVEILRAAGLPFALTHCTSMYPTPYDKVRLGAIADLRAAFPDAVVSITDIGAGDTLSATNIWVKRPGTGEIKARDFERVLGRRAARAIPANTQVRWSDLE